MPETKQITALHVVTDSESAHDNIGDIEGGYFDEAWLKRHITSHGVESLLTRFAEMSTQVINMQRQIWSEDEDANPPRLNAPS